MRTNNLGQAGFRNLPPDSVCKTELKQVLTRQEAAEYLSATFRTLRNWEKAGVLIPARLGKTIRYRLQDIESVLSKSVGGNN